MISTVGGAQETLFVGGAWQLAAKMAEALGDAVLVNAPVRSIAQSADGPVAGEPGEYYRQLGDTVSLVAISAAQRRAAPDLNWRGTVHNAIDVTTFPYRADKGEMVLFLGRLHPDKGVHLAIDAARGAGLPHRGGRQVQRAGGAGVLPHVHRAPAGP